MNIWDTNNSLGKLDDFFNLMNSYKESLYESSDGEIEALIDVAIDSNIIKYNLSIILITLIIKTILK